MKKTNYIHIRVSDEDKALINRKRGHKTVSAYMLGLVYGDTEDALRRALREYAKKMKVDTNVQ